MPVNEARLRAFLARALYDLAAAESAALVVIGDRLGLYRAMAGAGPLTAGELARRTGTDPSYVRTWLVSQAAGGYVEYDAGRDAFALPDEHAQVLAAEEGPWALTGGFELAVGLIKAEQSVAAAFRAGGGRPPDEYDPQVDEGMARSARARCRARLLTVWLPALDGVVGRLEAGARVADVGCGDGAALCLLAQAFPRSRLVGYDSRPSVVGRATRRAAELGLASRVRFEVASAVDLPDGRFDLVTCFDALHEMADPAAAARRVRAALDPDGTWLLVEPLPGTLPHDAGPRLRLLAATSLLYCLPVSRHQGAAGPGALLGEGQLEATLRAAGFARLRRLDDPFQLVLEARP